ncbi:hypothetical protein PHLCEN_2v13689 [Hermanssonia centrifuga]|uniref:Uncharacterized protein n=1 Tax=Hermanssonia centrifuga TaxID=98765 RepID=A0A2R6NDX7_9APHY|nr:hypothetical protein PHLCEN_2v13689 [Hermanssonia centrifuga]
MFGTFTLLTALAIFGVAQAAPAQVNSGDATFYAPGLGACGQTNSASDAIVAVSQSFFEGFP